MPYSHTSNLVLLWVRNELNKSHVVRNRLWGCQWVLSSAYQTVDTVPISPFVPVPASLSRHCIYRRCRHRLRYHANYRLLLTVCPLVKSMDRWPWHMHQVWGIRDMYGVRQPSAGAWVEQYSQHFRSFTIVTDVAILSLPIHSLWNLQVSRIIKAGLMGTFALGGWHVDAWSMSVLKSLMA